MPAEGAVAAFIGHTQRTTDFAGASLINRPVHIASLAAFQASFGRAMAETSSTAATRVPAFLLYYGVRLFFENGGVSCYVVSTGDYGNQPSVGSITDGLRALSKVDEASLIVFPDACLLTLEDYAVVIEKALRFCSSPPRRVAIIDVPAAVDDVVEPTASFRARIPDDPELLMFGAAYLPYLRTTIPIPESTTLARVVGQLEKSMSRFPSRVRPRLSDRLQRAGFGGTRASATMATVPPSGAVAGVFSRVARERGVGETAANIPLAGVLAPATTVASTVLGSLNIDPVAGKSVNAIREIPGNGTVIWGARTLSGNHSEYRYVSVRRYINYLEASISSALRHFASSPNTDETWSTAQSMIEKFLLQQWRGGVLQGQKPEEAFFVRVGLNATMTAEDVAAGKLIALAGVAILRPSEFLINRFKVEMQGGPAT